MNIKKKINEKICRTRKNNTIKRLWYATTTDFDNTIFKSNEKFSYIIDQKNKTVKVVPYNKEIERSISICNSKNKQILDIKPKCIEEIFKGFSSYKVTIFEDEILIQGYSEEQENIKTSNKLISFKKKKEAKESIIRISKKQLDEYILKASGDIKRPGFFDIDYDISTYDFSDEIISSYAFQKTIKKDKPIINKAIQFLSLFSGIGSPEMALRNIGIKYDLIGFSEIDKYAIKSYCAIHGTNPAKNLGDITKINFKNLANKIKNKLDLVFHGSPCFLKGELVNTIDGFKNIEDIKIGDIARSHDGTYNKVIETMVNQSACIYDIKCSATHNINTTSTHPFYVLRKGELQWVKSKDLTTSDFMAIPINKKQEEIVWHGCELNYYNRKEISNKLPIKDYRFWYLIGRFIGDGWVVRRKDRNNNISGIKICCAKYELEELEMKLGNVLHYNVCEDRTTYKLQFANKELGAFCSKFGIGAKNKKIPQDILDLKNEYLEYLLEGLIDSDGSETKDLYRITSTSKELIYNVGELILKVKNVPYMIFKSIRSKKCVIEGRTVNQNDTYYISFRLNNSNKKIHFIDSNYLYSRIRKINSRIEINDVYNIEVENTHSYCVSNIATHNCTDYSISGHKEGGNEGSGTRSSLMWYTVEGIKYLMPKFIIWENVKGVLMKNNIHNFNKYLDKLKALGYNNYHKLINAYDFGVAQYRERIFVVSIREDIDNGFEFPKGHDYKVNLEDVIDNEVDNKFYLKKILNPRKTKNYIQYDNSGKGHNSQQNRLYYLNKPMCTLPNRNGGDKTQILLSEDPLVGRKLTPNEVWRVMGFSQEDFEKASNSGQTMGSLYGQAGNSIVPQVLEEIFKILFRNYLRVIPLR